MAKEEKQDWKVVLKKNGKKITSITTFPGNWTTGQIKDWFKTEVLELTKLTKVKEEEQMSPENEMTPKQEMRYADELASRLPKDLTTEDEILEAGFKLAEKDIGRRSAIYYFQYDEDFASDFVSAYKEATPLGALSGQTYESFGRRVMSKFLEAAPEATTPLSPKDLEKAIKSYKTELANEMQGGTNQRIKQLRTKIADLESKRVKEAKDDSYYTTSASKAAELMKERFGATTKSTDKDGRWIFKDKNGVQVVLSDIDGEGDRTWNIFKSKAVKESALKEWGLTYDSNWKDQIEPEELETELIKYLNKKFGGKAWFKGDDYSYLMDTTKPTTLVATDGSVIKVKKLIDVEKYVNKHDFADFALTDPTDWADFFRPVNRNASNDQADHETKNRMGESLTLKEAGEYKAAYDLGKTHALNGEKKNPPWPKGYPYDLQHKSYAMGYKDWKPKQAPKAVAPVKGEEQIKESMMRDMLKMIPRGILGEESILHKSLDKALSKEKKASPVQVEKNKERWAKIQASKSGVDMEAVRALSDGKLKEMIKDFESQIRMGSADAKPGLKALKDEAKRRDSAGYVEEAVGETFKGYDVHHNPDSVMVLVLGSDEGAQDDYYGINVVFGKKGTKPELVTSDDLADRQAAKYKAQIIAAAEKRLGKEEKDHLASL